MYVQGLGQSSCKKIVTYLKGREHRDFLCLIKLFSLPGFLKAHVKNSTKLWEVAPALCLPSGKLGVFSILY